MFFINKEEINLFLVTEHQIPVKCANKYLYLHNCKVQVREISTEIFVLLGSLRPLPFGRAATQTHSWNIFCVYKCMLWPI